MTISVRGVIFGSRLPRYGVNFARRFTLRHFHEGSTIAQRAGFALNDCQIVAPIIDDAPRLARVIWAMLTTGKEYRDAERAMAA